MIKKQTDITSTLFNRIWTLNDVGKVLRVWILGHEIKADLKFIKDSNNYLQIIVDNSTRYQSITQDLISETFVDGVQEIKYPSEFGIVNTYNRITFHFNLRVKSFSVPTEDIEYHIRENNLGYFEWKFTGRETDIRPDAITKVLLLE